ncbi:MAG: hypothetical protein Q8Q42_00295, partial [Nanoarchaeota archaeon]|nr:hypothetical protein [Nanoarchaeota archaeon]
AVRIEYTDTARDRLVRSRNVLVDRMIDGKYDYFFSLEVDVIPPKDVIKKLLMHKKPIVSGVYFKPMEYVANGKVIKKEIVPLAYKFVSDKTKFVRRMTYEEVKGDDLIEAAFVGLGCVMIKNEVFESGIRFNYDEKKEIFDDNFFCKDAREKGYSIYLDTSVKCFHMVSGTNWKEIKK